MFDDPSEELRRLEEQLLAEETEPEEEPEPDDWLDDELAEAYRLLGDEPPDEDEPEDMDQTRVYRNFANGYGQPPVRNYANGYGAAPARNTDPADVDLEEYSDQILEEPKEKGVGGLVFLALLETLGIAAVAVYWLLVLL